MSSDGSRLLIILLILLFIRALYSFCERVIIEANDSKVKEIMDDEPKYKKLYNLISFPASIITTFSAHNILSILCICAVSLAFQSEIFQSDNIVFYIATVLIDAILISVLGDAIPKKIADKTDKEKTALSVVPFVKLMIAFMKPLSLIMNGTSFIAGKIFGVSSNVSDVVTEEEILMMVEAGNETGVIEESQCEMINNIFEFSDVTVSEIMTHRTDIIGLESGDKIRDVVYLAINEGFSRLPVYEGSIDKIIGIIYVKDLLCLIGCENPEEFNIRDFMREPMYIPATKKCDETFEIMTKKKVQMAVLVDEYGGTAGIVTMEDILEEIVGNIQDEYDEEEQDISELSKGVYIIDGSADPEDVLPELGVCVPDNREYDTMSAMIVDLLGRIPSEYEAPVVKYKNITFTVVVAEDNWISKIKAVVSEADENLNEEA